MGLPHLWIYSIMYNEHSHDFNTIGGMSLNIIISRVCGLLLQQIFFANLYLVRVASVVA